MVDDFPDDNSYWLDTDGDGWADNDTINEFDVDGDGWTDPSFTYSQFGIIIDKDGVNTKADPINVKERIESIQSIAIDLGMPIMNRGNLGIHIFSQIGMLIGKITDPKTKKGELGYGVTPFGVSASFGPARFQWEYRMMLSKF